MKIRHIISGVIMIGLIASSVYILGILVRPINTDVSFNAIDTFHDMPEDSIEVIGYGSSRMRKSLDSMTMYENYGVGVYNYGCQWQNFNTTYLFLLDSLQTQSPDVALIEVNKVGSILSNVNMGGEIYYTTAINESTYKYQYLYQCFGTEIDRYISYFVPVFAFHENWKSLEESNFMLNSSDVDLYKTMGYDGVDTVKSFEAVDSSTFQEKELGEESLELLNNIVDLCNENDIEIIFYLTPGSVEYKYSDAMATFAAENDCVYFDLFDYIEELNIDWSTDFADKSHLNNSGAAKVTNFLGAYIVENYDVTDMRTVEGNIWEVNSAR